MKNLYEQIPAALPEELTQILAGNPHVRIERIVSCGHASPANFWYDQDEHEWIALLKGAAKLQFAGENQPQHLTPGDHLLIPAHTKHRVEWTAPEEPTVWLAVFYRD